MITPSFQTKVAATAYATMTAFAVQAAQASGETYKFVNKETNQQIRVECSADPKGHSSDWWKANCKPVDQGPVGGEWTGGARDNHPDFLWSPE